MQASFTYTHNRRRRPADGELPRAAGAALAAWYSLLQQTPLSLAPSGDGRLTVNFRAPPTPLSLRQTLWYLYLGRAMVFESQRHMLRFAEAVRGQQRTLPGGVKLFSLDGESYNARRGVEGARRAPQQVRSKASAAACTCRLLSSVCSRRAAAVSAAAVQQASH